MCPINVQEPSRGRWGAEYVVGVHYPVHHPNSKMVELHFAVTDRSRSIKVDRGHGCCLLSTSFGDPPRYPRLLTSVAPLREPMFVSYSNY